MFTDIVGYTALMGQDEDKAYQILSENKDIHLKQFENFKGTLIKEMGDGILASFHLASDAVRCAVEIQKECQSAGIPLKIGIHEGEVMLVGQDVLGDGVNVASRLQDVCQQGCITVSANVYSNIKNKADISASYLGEKKLKNVEEPIRVYKVNWEGEPSELKDKSENQIFIPQNKSIIVLPFENISPDPDQEYFSDGLTEEIITDLSHIQDLLVISRNSAMTFKGTRQTTKEIAEKVNVRHVLEGSVRKAGNNLRITAQLIDAETDTHLWAEKYSGTLDDVFEIQEKVSKSIVDALSIKLSSKTKERLSERKIADFNVLDCWLKGQYELWKWTEEGLKNASILFQNALNVAGESPALCAGMGYVHYQFVNMGYSVDMDHLKKAEGYARHALKLDPDSPYGHVVLGLCLGSWGGQLREGIQHFKKALSVSPNDIDAVSWLVSYYAHLGKADAANLYLEKLMEIDPLSPYSRFMKGFIYMWTGQFDLAHEIYKKGQEQYPNMPTFKYYYALNAAYMNNIDEACKYFDLAHQAEPNSLFLKEGVFLSLALRGKKRELLSRLKGSDVEFFAQRNFAYSYYVSTCYAIIGEKEIALDWLDNSIQRCANYPFIYEYDPLLESIRGEERFNQLMKKAKYEWEHYEV
jgi:adenylate cyclase